MTTVISQIVIAVDQWVDTNAEEEGAAPRLLAELSIKVGFQEVAHLHVTAICVTDPDAATGLYFQEAVNAADEEDLNLLYQLTGAGKPLDIVHIRGAGDNKAYVVYAEPHEQ